MTFVDKFKQVCAAINEVVPQNEPKYVNTYNIHERSLPVGVDKPVMWGLTKEESQKLLRGYLKTKVVLEDEKMTVVYYDVVKDNGELSGVFDNPKEICKEVIWLD